MFESALLLQLIDLGGPAAIAALEWLVNGGCPSSKQRVEVLWLSEPLAL